MIKHWYLEENARKEGEENTYGTGNIEKNITFNVFLSFFSRSIFSRKKELYNFRSYIDKKITFKPNPLSSILYISMNSIVYLMLQHIHTYRTKKKNSLSLSLDYIISFLSIANIHTHTHVYSSIYVHIFLSDFAHN